MAELRRDMPLGGGHTATLIAFYRTRTTASWRIDLVIEGPDARYNPAYANVTPNSLPAFIASLQECHAMITSIGSRVPDGEFRHPMPIRYYGPEAGLPPTLEVMARDGRGWVVLSASTNTFRLYTSPLDASAVQMYIAALERAATAGPNLAAQLIELHPAAVPGTVPPGDHAYSGSGSRCASCHLPYLGHLSE